MEKKSILITGCSSGIGWCSALGLKNRGWQVFATARSDRDLERLEENGLTAIRMDYADFHTIASCADTVLGQTNGKLTALYNNGAYGQPGAVEDISTDVLRRQFETNLFGWHELTIRIIPEMRNNATGRIVNCSSVLGLVAMKYRGAYCASKFALEGLTDTLRLELRESGIFVSLIEPGPIRSQFLNSARKAFTENVDIDSSHHSDKYQERLKHFDDGGSSFFKLEPEAVLQKLIHAIESRKPRDRYFVTTPTYAMAMLKRTLPSRTLDAILSRG